MLNEKETHVYEKQFGETVARVRMTVDMNQDLHRQAKLLALTSGRKLNGIVEEALRLYLSKYAIGVTVTEKKLSVKKAERKTVKQRS